MFETDIWNENVREYFSVFNGFCIQIKMNPAKIPKTEMYSLAIYNKQQKLQVLIQEAGSSPYYQLNQDFLHGDIIEMGNANQSGKFYDVTFEEEIIMAEEEGECTTYGEGAEFKTYADCVASKGNQMFVPILGCSVPWLGAPGYTGRCTGRVNISEPYRQTKREIKGIVGQILKYTEFKSYPEFQTCIKPCREIKAISTLKRSVKVKQRYNMKQDEIHLNFKKTVKVTRYLKAYGVFELVVDVGSSLGLWIGLSVLGVFDLMFLAGIKIHNILGKRIFKPGRFHSHPPAVRGKYLYLNTYLLFKLI